MATLSPKYIAGFLDADGSIGVRFHADCLTPQMSVSFSQETSQDEVLQRIHEELGGSYNQVDAKGKKYTHLVFGGNPQSSRLLNRIKPFLVVKRHYAEVCLDLCSRKLSRDEIPAMREYLKIQRKQRSLPLPKHPTRGWLAGYLDGDGCISVERINRPSGLAHIVLHVAASAFDTEGIETIHKQFGGRINDMCEGRVRQYQLSLPASKVVEVFDPIVPYMIVKRDQAEFILKCAAMGHFRDGENIKAALKHLKAHPHRLNEPKPDLTALLRTVHDLPKHQRDPVEHAKSIQKMHAALAAKRAMRQSESAACVGVV
jgi:hypothetical protein